MAPSPSLQSVREGSRLLAQAFEQDPQNPFVLLLLAHFCLRQGFSDKASGVLCSVLGGWVGACLLVIPAYPPCSCASCWHSSVEACLHAAS